MRQIGHLPDDRAAATFSGFLRTRGIDNESERESDGTYAIWVRSDDQVEEGTRLLDEFRNDPGASLYKGAAEAGERIAAEAAAEAESARKRMFSRRDIWHQNAPVLTFILIIISIGVFILTDGGGKTESIQRFAITEYEVTNFKISWKPGLPEIRSGEFWRLITPIFVHYGIMHIFFNMLWMKDLGAMVEVRLGTTYLGLFVVITAILSNLAQYHYSAPSFGGMSGVVYGLLGFVWMKGRYDTNSGMALPPHIVAMMLIWLVVCYFMPRIANEAHLAGLIVGVIWGFLSAWRSRHFTG